MTSDDVNSALVELERPWDEVRLASMLPVPKADANKYTRGVLTVIAGSKRYPGAACLAVKSGLLMGAGYVKAATCKAAARSILVTCPSVVVSDMASWDARSYSKVRPDRPKAICIGPGFDPDDALCGKLVHEVLKHAACPVIVDGGALPCLASKKAQRLLSKRRNRGAVSVITPHAGEAARLASSLACNQDSDRPWSLAVQLARGLHAVVVLKGPDTYISDGKRAVPVYEGTPALAKAGTGDVLAGMVGALLSQGLDGLEAAVLGAQLHARAGRIAGCSYTEVCVTPEHVIDSIPASVRSFMDVRCDCETRKHDE